MNKIHATVIMDDIIAIAFRIAELIRAIGRMQNIVSLAASHRNRGKLIDIRIDAGHKFDFIVACTARYRCLLCVIKRKIIFPAANRNLGIFTIHSYSIVAAPCLNSYIVRPDLNIVIASATIYNGIFSARINHNRIITCFTINIRRFSIIFYGIVAIACVNNGSFPIPINPIIPAVGINDCLFSRIIKGFRCVISQNPGIICPIIRHKNPFLCNFSSFPYTKRRAD